MNEDQVKEAAGAADAAATAADADVAPEKADAASGASEAKPRARRARKGRVAVLVVVVVLVCAGAGMYVWHDQPGFCGTLCHIEQAYVDNYYQEQGQPGTDKYGNEVSDTNAMMAVLHRSNKTTTKPEIVCVDCHIPNMGELAHDGVNYVTGNYYQPRDERSGADLEKWDGKDSDALCANESCHTYLLGEDGTVNRDKLASATADMEFNPHDTHHSTQMQCTTCHKGHRASVLACTGCHEHEDVALPDGWISQAQSDELMDKSLKGE